MDNQELISQHRTNIRNLCAFWLLGLCNNFAYVIMLSAAHDILTPEANITSESNRSGFLIEHCNPIGTGAILLADILPALIVKLTAPFYVHLLSYRLKVCVVVLLSAASFLMVSLGGSHVFVLSIIGVIAASCGSGLGEFTFLSLTAHFDKNQVSTWSSGTGAAGVVGALSYAGLTAVHLSPSSTLLVMLIVPCLLAFTYFVLIVKPPSVFEGFNVIHSDERQQLVTDEPPIGINSEQVSIKYKFHLIKPLLWFMVPLFLVYFAEYFINQALFELVYFENIWLPREQQYRWYQVIYQVGVFISRSSVNCLQVPQVFIFPLFQFVNLILFVVQIHFTFIPSIWIIFFIILFEGLMGGGAYVNSFYHIAKKVDESDREFSMGVTSVSDSLGITFAAAIAIPIHNYLCTLPR